MRCENGGMRRIGEIQTINEREVVSFAFLKYETRASGTNEAQGRLRYKVIFSRKIDSSNELGPPKTSGGDLPD